MQYLLIVHVMQFELLFTLHSGKATFSGGYRERETPVPIPNTEVKLLIADGTARVTMWESRTLPGLQLYISKKDII